MMRYQYTIVSNDFVNAGKASSQIKQLLKGLGVDSSVLRNISIACYEAEINTVIHSLGGEVILEIVPEYVQLEFVDQGPGIENIEKALSPGFSTATEEAREYGFGAGMGLPNIKRVSDYFDIQSNPKGTKLTLRFEV